MSLQRYLRQRKLQEAQARLEARSLSLQGAAAPPAMTMGQFHHGV